VLTAPPFWEKVRSHDPSIIRIESIGWASSIGIQSIGWASTIGNKSSIALISGITTGIDPSL
jgi:hypothetical protein